MARRRYSKASPEYLCCATDRTRMPVCFPAPVLNPYRCLKTIWGLAYDGLSHQSFQSRSSAYSRLQYRWRNFYGGTVSPINIGPKSSTGGQSQLRGDGHGSGKGLLLNLNRLC